MSVAELMPPPPGATEPCVAPAPKACDWCHGGGVEPYEETAPIHCQKCDGAGVLPLVGFDLPPSRTHGLRRIGYTPTCGTGGSDGRLLIQTGTKATSTRLSHHWYEVWETENDFGGRSFVCAKVGRPDRAHDVFLGSSGVSCSCEGETYLSSAKANQRAHDAGGEVFPTFGCKHADALAALLLGGWFDLPEPTAEPPGPVVGYEVNADGLLVVC